MKLPHSPLTMVPALVLTLTVWLLAPAASADVLEVPAQYATIQSAIDAATDGDTVAVSPGTYAERIDFLGKAITVESTSGPDETILDGEITPVPIVSFRSGEGSDSILRGFTIQRAFGGEAGVGGGGILALSASPTIERNVITRNVAEVAGGGILLQGAGPDRAVIRDNEISLNTVLPASDGIGGGIYVEGGEVEIVGNIVDGNGSGALDLGGGIALFATRVTMRANTVTRNISRSGGGGVHAEDLLGGSFEDNLFTDGNSGWYAGMLLRASAGGAEQITIKKNRFEDNDGPSVGGLAVIGQDVRIINNDFIGNRSNGSGTGVLVWNSSGGTVEVKKNLFLRNDSGNSGGGLRIYRTDTVVSNNVFAFNSARIEGGAVSVATSGSRFVNTDFSCNTVYGNTADNRGGGIFDRASGQFTCTNSIVWANDAPEFPQIAIQGSATFCDVEGGVSGGNNIDEDPLFVNPQGGDFHLRLGSPCVDAGWNFAPGVPPVDFEGDERPLDGDPDLPMLVDMGADEVDPTHAALFGTVNAGLGALANVLTVNDDDGGDERLVRVPVDGPIVLSIVKPPAGGSGKYVIHANAGRPSTDSITLLPSGYGWVGFPLFLPAGASPIAIFNSYGKVNAVGESTYFDGTPLPTPPPADADFLVLPGGDPINLPVGTVFTLQGGIVDPGSAATKPGSATNGLIIVVE